MGYESLSVQDRIILAAINITGKEGLPALTTRRIAKEAGVNSAAINYYFGSKEKLIEIALKRTLNEMTTLPEEMSDLEGLNPRQKLKVFFLSMLNGIYLYPGITKAHLFGPLMKDDYSLPFTKRFSAFLDDVLRLVKEVDKKAKEDDLKRSIVQMIAAVVLPPLLPKMFKSFGQENFATEKDRKKYIDTLVDHYFPVS